MKKAYSHFAALVLAAMAFSSCSRADYASNQAASPLAEASITQAPAAASPTVADMSAEVVAHPSSTEALAPAAPAPTASVAPATAPRRAATPAPATATITATAVVANPDITPAKAAKPTLVQRLVLQKVVKQFSKAELRHQNTANTEQTAARGGSLTILLVGIILLLLGIIISANWLTTVGAIITVVGLILLLLTAL